MIEANTTLEDAAKRRGDRWGNNWRLRHRWEKKTWLDYLKAGWKCSLRAYKTAERQAHFRIGWLFSGWGYF